MASWLDEYQNIKTDMERDFNGAIPAVEQLIVYQELIYRIGVLEMAKELCSSAPVTTDTKALVRHYQLVDAYLRCVVNERRFGPPADVKLKERRGPRPTRSARYTQTAESAFRASGPSTKILTARA